MCPVSSVQIYYFLHIQLPATWGPMAFHPVLHLFFPAADAQASTQVRSKPKTGLRVIERRFKSKRESKHLPCTAIHHQESPSKPYRCFFKYPYGTILSYK
jgi:hypothetical protein